MIAEEENLTRELTEDNRLVFEPGYAAYLRSQGHIIEDITDIDTVASGSDPDKKYLVGKIVTYDYPRDHSELDFEADRITIPVCTCWNWRSQQSADLDTQKPSESGTCKHHIEAYRTEKAKADESQETL